MTIKSFTMIINKYTLLIAATVCVTTLYAAAMPQKTIDCVTEGERITALNIGPEKSPVEFRNDSLGGPALLINGRKLPLEATGRADSYTGHNDSLSYSLRYHSEGDGFALTVTCTNLTKKPLSRPQLTLMPGINTDMDSFPHWHKVFFPTLLRCEKTHFWGYLMNPDGRIITVTSPDPVASYRLLYNNDSYLHSFGHGHRIRSFALDLINPAPLPDRHPALHNLQPGQTLKWNFFIDEVGSLNEVAAKVSSRTKAPVMQADYYSPTPGSTSEVIVTSPSSPKMTLTTPAGTVSHPSARKSGRNTWTVKFSPSGEGVYTLVASASGHQSEMKLTSRTEPYSAYIDAARRASLLYPQKPTSHTESWYGFFPAYKAAELMPDRATDASVDSLFKACYVLMYDSVTNRPLAPSHPDRIQNHALMAALLAQRYRASRDLTDLMRAADLADYILYRQTDDGAYRNRRTHYTSVIYVAKAIMEVMAEEKPLADAGSEEWRYRYDKHFDSVRRAIDDLADNLDNIETEGEMTFEDGMISCSYTQISQFALMWPEGSPERKRYTEAAARLADMHRCLSQLLVPDSRRNGGSLRFWESQYDILTFPDMTCSPHGWSGWRIYGLRNLYLLTGRYDYLRQMVNAIGSCIQVIDPHSATLQWAFISDPYIEGDVFVPDPANPGKGKYESRQFGECYMPMISDWYRTEPGKAATGYWGYDGGCCDNDVHEIFKCLGEVLLTSAYIHRLPDGRLDTINCTAEVNSDGSITAHPAEKYIDTVWYCDGAGMPRPVGSPFRINHQ